MTCSEKTPSTSQASESASPTLSSRENLKKTLELVGGTVSPTDDSLYKPDTLQTPEQHQRDTEITGLLRSYAKAYKDKREFQNEARYKLFVLCHGAVIVFSLLFVMLIIRVIMWPKISNMPDIIAFVTACVSFLGLIFELLTVITKYCFPENDEEYITRIVQAIQENDLKHKQTNLDYAKEKPAEKADPPKDKS